MADIKEETENDSKEYGDIRRTRAPSKKKFDEDMDLLCANIRKTEEQLEALKNAKPSSFADALRNLRAEKSAIIERQKKIDSDLQKLNKDISEMMHSISRLESTLHYRSEDRIDEAIRRLEWSLKMQNFKLSQEKKIVAEIDSLRRSKKTLMQYLSMKKDKDGMRDRQRRMREERDYYFHKVTQLKQSEEKLKSDNSNQKSKMAQLKKELDKLYEAKRQMVSVFKKQREEFHDDREKRRHESFKKRIEEKQAIQAALRQEIEEYEAQKQPYEDEISLCNTLIHHLQRFIMNTDLDASCSSGSSPSAAGQSSPSEEPLCGNSASGPAEELEDGQYVLLRKSDNDNYVTGSSKHNARKQRRSRKQSMVKRITHTPEVLSQFMRLNLNAPATVAEILASLEQLKARKLFYERERDAEVKSDAELSVTESAHLEMSRQASHTESTDGLAECRPGDHVVEQLLQLSMATDASSAHPHPASPSWVPATPDCGDKGLLDTVEMEYLQTVDPSVDFTSSSPSPSPSSSLSPSHSQSRSRSAELESSSSAHHHPYFHPHPYHHDDRSKSEGSDSTAIGFCANDSVGGDDFSAGGSLGQRPSVFHGCEPVSAQRDDSLKVGGASKEEGGALCRDMRENGSPSPFSDSAAVHPRSSTFSGDSTPFQSSTASSRDLNPALDISGRTYSWSGPREPHIYRGGHSVQSYAAVSSRRVLGMSCDGEAGVSNEILQDFPLLVSGRGQGHHPQGQQGPGGKW